IWQNSRRSLLTRSFPPTICRTRSSARNNRSNLHCLIRPRSWDWGTSMLQKRFTAPGSILGFLQTGFQGRVPHCFIVKSSPYSVKPSQIRRHSIQKAATSIRATADTKPLFVFTNGKTSLVLLVALPFAELRRAHVQPISARVVSAGNLCTCASSILLANCSDDSRSGYIAGTTKVVTTIRQQYRGCVTASCRRTQSHHFTVSARP